MRVSPARIGVGLILGAIFVVLLILNGLTPLWGDDWWRVVTPDQIGMIPERIRGEYLGWTGRVSTLLLTFLMLLKYPGSLVLFDIVNSAVVCLLTVVVFRGATGRLPGVRVVDAAGLALAFVGIWFLTHAFGEAVLWKTGAVAYLWPTTAALIALIPFVDVLADHRVAADTPFRLWVAPLLCLFWAMTLENVAVSVAVFMLYVVAASRLRRVSLPRWYWRVLAGQVAGTVVLVAAPGNFARAAVQDDGQPVWHRFGELVALVWRHGTVDTRVFVVMGALLLVLALQRQPVALARAYLWMVLGLMFALSMIGSTGVNFAQRTAFAADVGFVVVVVSLAWPLLTRGGGRRILALPLVALIVAVWVADAVTTLEQYLATWQQTQRRESLMAAYRKAGLRHIVLPSIQVPYEHGLHDDIVDGRFFLRDIHPPMDGNEWRNGTFAHYHGFDFALRLAKPHALYERELDAGGSYTPLGRFAQFQLYWRPEAEGFRSRGVLYVVSERRVCVSPEPVRAYARDSADLAPADRAGGFVAVAAQPGTVAWVDAGGRESSGHCVARLPLPDVALSRVTFGGRRLGRSLVSIEMVDGKPAGAALERLD